VKTVWFDELPLYPVRSCTYRSEQVRVDEVQRVIVYTPQNVVNKIGAVSGFDSMYAFIIMYSSGFNEQEH
jgi:hypothetical protein